MWKCAVSFVCVTRNMRHDSYSERTDISFPLSSSLSNLHILCMNKRSNFNTTVIRHALNNKDTNLWNQIKNEMNWERKSENIQFKEIWKCREREEKNQTGARTFQTFFDRFINAYWVLDCIFIRTDLILVWGIWHLVFIQHTAQYSKTTPNSMAEEKASMKFKHFEHLIHLHPLQLQHQLCVCVWFMFTERNKSVQLF